MPVSSRWLIISAIPLALFLLILIGAPYAIQHLARQWLEQHGGEYVEIQDVDFNPFTATLIFEGVEIQVEDRKPLHFDSVGLQLAWLPLLDKRIDVQHLELNGFHILVRNQDALHIGGILIEAGEDVSEAEPEESSWLAGIKSVTLTDFTLLYADPKIASKLFIDTLTLSELTQWAPETPARLAYRGALNDAAVELDAMLAPFAATPAYTGSLRIEKLPLAGFASLARPALEELAGLVSLDGDFEVTQTETEIHILHRGRLAIDDIRVIHETAHVTTPAAEWNGTTNVDIGMAESQTRAQVDGKLLIGKLATDLPQQKFRLTWDDLDLQGAFSWADSATEPELKLNTDIALTGLDLKASEKAVDVISAQKLHVDGLSIEGTQQVTIDKVVAEGLDLGRNLSEQKTALDEEDKALFHAGKVTLEKFSHIDGFTSIDTILEDDVHAIYHRDKQGQWKVNLLLDVLAGEEKPAETGAADAANDARVDSPPAAGAKKSEPPPIAVGHIEASKGSSLTILDEAVTPVFRETVTINELWIKDLDGRKPDQASTLKLDGTIGKYSTVTADGEIWPFLQPPGLDIKAELFALDLPKLSSYTRDSMGLLLDSGTLDVDLVMLSKDKLMDGKAVLKLHQLTLESTGSEDGFASKLPVSMDVALDTLRDKNNTIELDIPIKGDAENPDFDVSDAINQVVAKAVVMGATSYLKYALQPYGAILLVAEYAGEAATRVRLDPVEFEPGQATMDDTDRDYLSKVAQILKDRPKLAFKLCGVAVQKDALYYQQQLAAGKKEKPGTREAAKEIKEIPVDTEKLTALAKQRAAAVKEYLVDHFKAPANHLVGCQPRLETGDDGDADAAPRTDILI